MKDALYNYIRRKKMFIVYYYCELYYVNALLK